MVFTQLAPFPYQITPMANITPFTYRDGDTYLTVLENLKNWIDTVLIPHVNNYDADVLAQYQNGIDNAEQTVTDAQTTWQTRFDTFMADITAQIAALNDAGVTALVNNATSATGSALRSLITASITNQVTAAQVISLIGSQYYNRTDADATFQTKTDATAAQSAAAATATADRAAAANATADKADPGDTDPLGNRLYKLGIVLDKGATGSFDNVSVESLTTFVDPESGRLAGVYTGYGDAGGVTKAGIGLAYSDDGVTWTKAGQLFGPTGVVGDADKGGTTGPRIVLHNGIYHLYYIGLSETGYEGGARSVMLATSPSLKNPVWTRRGKILDKGGVGWRSQDVWHPDIVQHNGTWFCFVNATGVVAGVTQERIGYATAPAPTGPWTFDDLNSPLVSGDGIIGDPCVSKIPGGWRMDYYYANGGTASDWYTTTTDTAFPLGWRQHDPAATGYRTLQQGPPATIDEQYAHKPWVQRYAGRTFHYYTAVNTNADRRIAVAVDPGRGGIPLRGKLRDVATPSNIGTLSQIKSGPADGDKICDANWGVALLAAAVISAKVGDTIELTLGYAANDDTGDCRADAVILVNGTAVNYLSKNEHGFTRWGAMGGRFTSAGGTAHYTLQPEDVYRDTITIAPVFRCQTGTRRVFGTTADPIEFTVRNLG